MAIDTLPVPNPIPDLNEPRKKGRRAPKGKRKASNKRGRRRPRGFGTVFPKGTTFAFRLPVPGRRRPIEGYGFATERLAHAALDKARLELQQQRTGVIDPKTIPTVKS